MALTNNPIYNSFIRLDAPDGYGDCETPQVCLPVIEPSDLAFQLKFLASGADFLWMMQINIGSSFVASASGTVLTVTQMNSISIIYPGFPLTGAVGTGTTIINQVSGVSGGVGVYTLSSNNFFSSENLSIAPTNLLGKIAAVAVAEGESAPPYPVNDEFDWIMTAAAPTGVTVTVDNVGIPEWVCYFQPATPMPSANWLSIENGACFNIYFYLLQYQAAGTGWALNSISLSPLSTYTCFSKITGSCESYPTSLIQYAGNNDAFGFYYDGLTELVDNINFVNSVRLPMYLHSPEQAEDQLTYNLSNGAALKLSHRIWTDYKFKTDWLPAGLHRALVVATAHDLVFIGCAAEGIAPGGWPGWVYAFTASPTQFTRTEKIDVEWQQETIPRFKLGQAKGTLRLALSSSNTNSNCT